MTTGQGQSAPVICPRCGGSMYKPEGSPFYWHADTTHPNCTITNLLLPISSVPEPSAEVAPRPVQKKKKSS